MSRARSRFGVQVQGERIFGISFVDENDHEEEQLKRGGEWSERLFRLF